MSVTWTQMTAIQEVVLGHHQQLNHPVMDQLINPLRRKVMSIALVMNVELAQTESVKVISTVQEMVTKGIKAGICQYKKAEAKRRRRRRQKKSNKPTNSSGGQGETAFDKLYKKAKANLAAKQNANCNLQQSGILVAGKPQGNSSPKLTTRVNEHRLIKSPSDTTIYRPALNQGVESNLVNRISNFVENIRIETTGMHNSPVMRRPVPNLSPARTPN